MSGRAQDPRLTEYFYGDINGLWARAFPAPGAELTIVQWARSGGVERQVLLPILCQTNRAIAEYYGLLVELECPSPQQTIAAMIGITQTTVSAHILEKLRTPRLRVEGWSGLARGLAAARLGMVLRPADAPVPVP